jgi:hypothetical protein
VIGLITGCLVNVVAVMGDVFILVYNFHVLLALKVGCPSSGVSCDIALVFIFLCVGLMAIFVVLRFSPVSPEHAKNFTSSRDTPHHD